MPKLVGGESNVTDAVGVVALKRVRQHDCRDDDNEMADDDEDQLRQPQPERPEHVADNARHLGLLALGETNRVEDVGEDEADELGEEDFEDDDEGEEED